MLTHLLACQCAGRWTLVALGFGCLSLAGPLPVHADDPWAQALNFDYPSAEKGFADRSSARPDDARVTIAYASLLLVKQPLTTGNIERAYALLAEVAGRAEAGENALLALYLCARVEQDHLIPARLADARRHYREVIARNPRHALAGQASVQLALLDAWSEPRLPVGTAVAHIEALLAAAASPEAQRELHFILGRLLYEDRRDAAGAIAHLRAGRALDYAKPFRNAEVDLMIANLSRQAGDPATALVHYRAFLQSSPSDVRASTVRRYIGELDPANPPAIAPAP